MMTAGLALAGCNTMNGDDSMAPAGPMAPGGAMAGDPSNPLMASGYVPMAASGDQFEIQASQLALTASANTPLKNYANMMIAAHQQTLAALAAATQSAGLPPPPMMLLPQQQQMLDQLRAAGSGQAFDDAYKAMQIQAHQAALQLNQNYAASGDVPALRQNAATAVPLIQQHLAEAQALNTTAPVMSPMGAAPMAPATTTTTRPGERG
jgi:putative membrane protein